MLLRPRLSAFSFCLSTASCSASCTKTGNRLTLQDELRNSVIDWRVGVFGA
ncbi:hypothetical protein PF005_g16380 [Phytophthora fragariae]|uniref:RxLR effector protein n=1 Tax=Phytophthora fragariae TaxID=53985 RepID=A0A6A3JSB4_9STRA|nr:hypothetical protein PF003_g21078 [Phytophthora fragariae]KAE8932274.1 hypothetical protein PF009_g17689 [Phytophthora fragariae]KAE8997731.1 hypothetical protein PF011_g15350 [Phytophthora fragariae]KAE9097782.1 hypothetical protein PF007_g16510 [Phytophthora fragariae]KAE9108683.1 hypothetical protein PF010_g11811 [Phytophthora fragariae]